MNPSYENSLLERPWRDGLRGSHLTFHAPRGESFGQRRPSRMHDASNPCLGTRNGSRLDDSTGSSDETLESRLQERIAQWEAAKEELEAFSYSVSHDLRAPLRAIQGFSRILASQNGLQLDEQGRQCLDIICSEAERMGRLIEELLRYSRVGQCEMHRIPIDTNAMVREVWEMLTAPVDNRKIDLRLHPLPCATADPVLLRQVWTNLLDNALKYTRNRELAVVEIGVEIRGGETVFFIRDNGAGFDAKYADKLFQVFQRLHCADDFEGDGVGLAIVQRIVHRHRGRVWAESQPDRGTAFYFTLND
jgi:light-regulated signal transduction histidine kinase (bacteriophytochrome)